MPTFVVLSFIDSINIFVWILLSPPPPCFHQVAQYLRNDRKIPNLVDAVQKRLNFDAASARVMSATALLECQINQHLLFDAVHGLCFNGINGTALVLLGKIMLASSVVASDGRSVGLLTTSLKRSIFALPLCVFTYPCTTFFMRMLAALVSDDCVDLRVSVCLSLSVCLSVCMHRSSNISVSVLPVPGVCFNHFSFSFLSQVLRCWDFVSRFSF